MTLRDRLRAGDIWVEGSRAFRTFDDFLLPPAAFAAKRKADELELAVPDRFETWRDERLETLERRLREVATLASAGKLPEALITEAGLSINSPVRRRTNRSAKPVHGEARADRAGRKENAQWRRHPRRRAGRQVRTACPANRPTSVSHKELAVQAGKKLPGKVQVTWMSG
jgi:hypothetical protein